MRIKGNVSFVLPRTLRAAVVLFRRSDIYCVDCAESKKDVLLRCQPSGLMLFSPRRRSFLRKTESQRSCGTHEPL